MQITHLGVSRRDNLVKVPFPAAWPSIKWIGFFNMAQPFACGWSTLVSDMTLAHSLAKFTAFQRLSWQFSDAPFFLRECRWARRSLPSCPVSPNALGAAKQVTAGCWKSKTQSFSLLIFTSSFSTRRCCRFFSTFASGASSQRTSCGQVVDAQDHAARTWQQCPLHGPSVRCVVIPVPELADELLSPPPWLEVPLSSFRSASNANSNSGRKRSATVQGTNLINFVDEHAVCLLQRLEKASARTHQHHFISPKPNNEAVHRQAALGKRKDTLSNQWLGN